MLKALDVVILLKLLANPDRLFSQRELASALCIGLADINGGLKRLVVARLLRRSNKTQFIPIIAAAGEFLVHGLKYLLPGNLGALTSGVPTSIGATLFDNQIVRGDEPIPIWPDIHGLQRGLALMPIHPSITKALRQTPDPLFYDLLVLIDVIRSGQIREKTMAVKLLKEKIGWINGKKS